MRHYVHALRQKSDRTKTIISYAGAGSITLGIIALWVFALPGGKPFETTIEPIRQEQPASLFQSLIGNNKQEKVVAPETQLTPVITPVTATPSTTPTATGAGNIQQGATIYEPPKEGIVIPDPAALGSENGFLGEQVFIETSSTQGSTTTNETTYSIGGTD